jgi:hypothetical protein
MPRVIHKGEKALTPQMRAAAEHYMAHGDKKAAYCAGYPKSKGMSPQAISKNASVVFRSTVVQDYIRERTNRTLKPAKVTADRVIGELAEIGFGPAETPRAYSDKINALKVLALRLGLLEPAKKKDEQTVTINLNL